tara:strand:- start:1871 stop:2335 length:465 start_codon:yes stop_codon:yes gene_type:complete
MTAAELKDRIKLLVKQVYTEKSKADEAAVAYDELTKFPLLKDVIVDLLTHEFDSFLEDIEWVSPRPTVFRIKLLNGESFLLMYTERSWIATVEGKKYYLLNLDEEENCALAIGRILQYGPASGAEVEGEESAESEADAGTEVEDEVDVNVDVEA